MQTISKFITESIRLLGSIGLSDVIDILIIAVGIYWLIGFIRRTNSTKVANAIVMLVLALWLSGALNLNMTNYVLKAVFDIGVLAVIILFQPEIRRALEKVGSRSPFIIGRDQSTTMDSAIMQTVFACEAMSRSRTGALIVFERDNRLGEAINSGTILDAKISSELLRNIFYDKSPLHDGAVIIKDGRITAAGCMLPLSSNGNLSRDLGMRHRAALGISEQTDAVVAIVSEETGAISLTVDGMLKRHLSQDTFETLLRNELLSDEPPFFKPPVRRRTFRDRRRSDLVLLYDDLRREGNAHVYRRGGQLCRRVDDARIPWAGPDL